MASTGTRASPAANTGTRARAARMTRFRELSVSSELTTHHQWVPLQRGIFTAFVLPIVFARIMPTVISFIAPLS